MQNARRPARINYFHGTKQKVLGNGKVPPAWRVPTPTGSSSTANTPGSKILISRLPGDVDVKEVEELFRQTVGPLREVLIIYNSQGKSKGMAIVEFARPGDAVIARRKYHGKVVDARRPIKIEIVSDSDVVDKAAPAPSLFARLGGMNGTPTAPQPAQKAVPKPQPTVQQQQQAASSANSPRRRYKKGPKRLKKRVENLARGPATREQLDKEMEDYRASALGIEV